MAEEKSIYWSSSDFRFDCGVRFSVWRHFLFCLLRRLFSRRQTGLKIEGLSGSSRVLVRKNPNISLFPFLVSGFLANSALVRAACLSGHWVLDLLRGLLRGLIDLAVEVAFFCCSTSLLEGDISIPFFLGLSSDLLWHWFPWWLPSFFKWLF